MLFLCIHNLSRDILFFYSDRDNTYVYLIRLSWHSEYHILKPIRLILNILIILYYNMHYQVVMRIKITKIFDL